MQNNQDDGATQGEDGTQDQPLPPMDDLPTLDTVHSIFIPTMQWVLKPARAEFSRVFASLCNKVAYNPDSIAGWILLSMFALQPIIKIIAQRVPRIRVNAWYLDDGAIVGKKEELQEAVDVLQEHGPARGLILSTSATTNNNPKSSVWCPSAVRAVNLTGGSH